MNIFAVKKIAVCFIFSAAVLSSCGGNPPVKKIGPKAFPEVSVPYYLALEKDQAQYLAKNWWNRYLDSSLVWSQDTSLIGGVSKSNFVSAFRNYVNILMATPPAVACQAQENLIGRIQKIKTDHPSNNVFENMVSLTEIILYGVNSDFRNEEYYLPFAKALSTSPLVDSVSRVRYAKEAAMCSLNRLGTPAADFSYTTKEGKVSSLYKNKADYILLFFSNPGCTSCKEIIDALKADGEVGHMEESGILKVLNIYIDEDLAEWYKYMPIYPKEWVNAYNADLSIRTYTLYDVRAIPSLYLLDREKRVILKDAPLYLIQEFFHRASMENRDKI